MWYLARTDRQPLADAVLNCFDVFHHPFEVCEVIVAVLRLPNDRALTLPNRCALGVERLIPTFGNFERYLRICIFYLLMSMALYI